MAQFMKSGSEDCCVGFLWYDTSVRGTGDEGWMTRMATDSMLGVVCVSLLITANCRRLRRRMAVVLGSVGWRIILKSFGGLKEALHS